MRWWLCALCALPTASPATLSARPVLPHRPVLPSRRVGAVRLTATDGRPGTTALTKLLEENRSLRDENTRLTEENRRLQMAADAINDEIITGELLARAARRSLLNNIATINLLVIVTFGMGVAYSLLETDIRAITALYYFDLGDDLYPGFARAAIAVDLILRLPGELLHQYEALVPTNPVFYKACTSGVAYTFGDFISQLYQGRDLKTLDLPRSLRSGAAGFIGHGPLCHYWMLAMERYLDFGGAWWATGFKVLADQTVWSLYLNAMYSFLIGTLAFRNPRDVWADVKSTSWPALRSSWRFWPFVHCISFSHAVPLDLKLLWVDVMEIVWVTILSRVANQDDNGEEENQDIGVVVESFGVDPTLEIALSQQVMSGTLTYDSSAGWKCSEDGDCWVLADDGAGTAGSSGGPFAGLTLPSGPELLDASIPLALMWPVLFAFYQGELALGLDV